MGKLMGDALDKAIAEPGSAALDQGVQARIEPSRTGAKREALLQYE